MRTAFIEALIASARTHPDIFLVVGDLGFSVVEPFAREFPDRFLNAGVAEQNMTGMAAGLASEGYHVFTYSIANFPTIRCLEQIRNDVCYHKFPVTVVAVGAGLAYGNLGYSHHAVQDLACLRGMPGISIFNPADPGETKMCVESLTANPRPSYLRLGKAGERSLHNAKTLGDGLIKISGVTDCEVAVVASGSILGEVIAAVGTNDQVAIYSMPQLTLHTADVWCRLWKYRVILSVEEHVAAGGLGELIASLRPNHVKLKILALKDEMHGEVGSQIYLRRLNGLDSATIKAVLSDIIIA